MLYAVSVETTQVLPVGRAKRVARVFVDAPNGDEAGRLAARRFRNRPEIKRCTVRGVARVMQMPAAPLSFGEAEMDIRAGMAASRKRRATARRRMESA